VMKIVHIEMQSERCSPLIVRGLQRTVVFACELYQVA
jgi:hypothetical protein